MWPNPQETADVVTFTGKSLMENFIIYTVNNYSYLSTEKKNDII